MDSSTLTSTPRIVIIGGGATGTGIAREAAERGYEVVLVEREELGSGTSGNFHGILHSGARYAVNDRAVAAECYAENQRLRGLIPSAITATGGICVALTDAEAMHSRMMIQACAQAGIPIKQLTPAQALQAEPNLNPAVKAAFSVPDGFIDGSEVLRLNRQAAVEASVSATFLSHHVVEGFERPNGDTVTAVLVRDTVTNEVEWINCDYVISAAGIWAGRISGLAGIDIPMVYDKGTMLIYDESFTSRVINRCRPEDDGDLLAPHGQHSIMGTTSRVISDPDDNTPSQEEIEVLRHEGAALVPKIAQSQFSFAYAGVRPLMSPSSPTATTASRSISRAYKVLDHASDGVPNFISVIGGKVTLYRRMAAAAVDLLDTKTAYVRV